MVLATPVLRRLPFRAAPRAARAAVLLAVLTAPLAAEHRVATKTEVDDVRFTRECRVLRDGAILAFYRRPGAGVPLVLVPETHGDRSQFYEPAFLDALGADRPLLVIESRGQGRSWPPPTPEQASIAHYADDVLEIVQALGLKTWDIGGHSLGGMIAIEVAGRRPSGLRAVIALEGWPDHRVQAEAFPPVARTEAQSAEARRQRQERYRSQRWNDAEVIALGQMWRNWTHGEAILREIDYPVLSVWGDRGLAQRPDRRQLRLPDRANVDVVWIEGSDHYVTDPPHAASTAQAIEQFLRRLGSPGASR